MLSQQFKNIYKLNTELTEADGPAKWVSMTTCCGGKYKGYMNT